MGDRRQQAIAEHIEWCKRERDACARQLDMMENGSFKMGHMGTEGMKDDTPAWIEKHRATIAQMDKIIAAYGESGA